MIAKAALQAQSWSPKPPRPRAVFGQPRLQFPVGAQPVSPHPSGQDIPEQPHSALDVVNRIFLKFKFIFLVVNGYNTFLFFSFLFLHGAVDQIQCLTRAGQAL